MIMGGINNLLVVNVFIYGEFKCVFENLSSIIISLVIIGFVVILFFFLVGNFFLI